jgi:hypothetical protein
VTVKLLICARAIKDGLPGLAGVSPAREGRGGRDRGPEGTPLGARVTVTLVMSVTRGEDERLSGSIGLAGQELAREFSGTLELLRAFEELVPAQDTIVDHLSRARCEHTPSTSESERE